jgi:hypothetical protein
MYDLILGKKPRKLTYQLDQNLLMGDPVLGVGLLSK